MLQLVFVLRQQRRFQALQTCIGTEDLLPGRGIADNGVARVLLRAQQTDELAIKIAQRAHVEQLLHVAIPDEDRAEGVVSLRAREDAQHLEDGHRLGPHCVVVDEAARGRVYLERAVEAGDEGLGHAVAVTGALVVELHGAVLRVGQSEKGDACRGVTHFLRLQWCRAASLKIKK